MHTPNIENKRASSLIDTTTIEDLLKLRDQIPALESAGIHSTISLHDAITLCAAVNHELVETELNVDPYCGAQQGLTELLQAKGELLLLRKNENVQLKIKLDLYREFYEDANNIAFASHTPHVDLREIVNKMKEQINGK
jgi:hypothetical protein